MKFLQGPSSLGRIHMFWAQITLVGTFFHAWFMVPEIRLVSHFNHSSRIFSWYCSRIYSALRGGIIDQLFGRFIDVLMAIPTLIFSLLMLTIFGTSVLSLVLVIATIDSTRVFRIARAVALNIVVLDYIEAAKLRGESTAYLITREILPNSMAPLAAEFGLRFCFVFLTISSLSFLGLGLQPPLADWGSMVRDNAELISFGDITPLIPAGAIAVLTIAVNFVVDWLLHRASGLKD